MGNILNILYGFMEVQKCMKSQLRKKKKNTAGGAV